MRSWTPAAATADLVNTRISKSLAEARARPTTGQAEYFLGGQIFIRRYPSILRNSLFV